MTIVMAMVTPNQKSISASAFKAQCLALMDEVAQTGEAILITKKGKPVAQLIPAPNRMGGRNSVFGLHKGMVGPIGEVDLDAPILSPSDWTTDTDNLDSK
jgi:prevent-host-death family protein